MNEYIYLITCTANGKQYVGKARDVGIRWGTHRRTLNNGTHHNVLIQRAWDKYGRELFTFEIIDEVPAMHIFKREIELIAQYDTFNNGFNLTKGGEGGNSDGLVKARLLSKTHLTEDDIVSIYFDTYSSLADISYFYGVSIVQVSRIQSKKEFKVIVDKLPKVKRNNTALIEEGIEQMYIYNTYGGNYKKVNGKRVLTLF